MMFTSNDLDQFTSPTWKPPEPSSSVGVLGTCLWATYKAPVYNQQIIPGRFVEGFVGEHVELHCTLQQCNRAFEVIRKPAAAKRDLSGTRLPLDVAGLYIIRITLEGAWTQDVRIAVFPREVEKWLGFPGEKLAKQRRLRLRQIIRDTRVTDGSVIDSIENDDDPMFGMGGRIVGLRPLEAGSGATGHETFSVNQYNG